MSHPARRRDSRTAARTPGGRTPLSRRRHLFGATLSEAAARRLLDGGDDGPPPLPQLLSAAAAPGTAAELQGEAAARAAFRSSVHAAPSPVRGPRTARARAAATIVTAKIIAAVVLTAGTAGGVALATSSYSAHLQHDPTITGTDTAVVSGVSRPGIATSTTVPPTQAPDGAERSGSSAGARSDGGAAGARTTPPLRPAPAPDGGERCGASCTAESTGATGPTSDQSGPPPDNGDGEKPAEEKSTGNDNQPDKGKDNNNGKKSVNGKEPDDAGNPGKKDKAADEGQSVPGSTQTGVGKSQSKKKTDAGTTTT